MSGGDDFHNRDRVGDASYCQMDRRSDAVAPPFAGTPSEELRLRDRLIRLGDGLKSAREVNDRSKYISVGESHDWAKRCSDAALQNWLTRKV